MYLFFFYNIFLTFLSPFIFLYLVIYSVFSNKHRHTILERFGSLNFKLKSCLWFHAVSVGEVTAAAPLIKNIQKSYQGQEIILSITTKTGRKAAEKILSGIKIIYFPLDLFFVVKKVINFLNPRAIFILETEIWPNLIYIANERKIPIYLVNGRVSDRAFSQPFVLKPLFNWMYEKISLFCMQTNFDAERIVKLGVEGKKVIVTGNMKIDGMYSDFSLEEKSMPLFNLFNKDLLFIAGSTHQGEENVILSVYKELLKEFNNMYLLIAPRHINRVKEVTRLIQGEGFEFILRSELKENFENFKPPIVIVLDTIGELRNIYSRGDLIFVGGSLIKRGGHNLLEPAAFSKAVFFGPSYENFRESAKILKDTGVGIEVSSAEDFVEKALKHLKNEDGRKTIEEKAKKLILNNLGATERTLNAVMKENPGLFQELIL